MRIALDVQAGGGRATGLGVYTERLAEFLPREKPEGWEVSFLRAEGRGSEWNTFERLWWENVRLPARVLRHRPDLLHVPAFAAPLAKFCRLVVTVHDIIGALFPNQMSWPSRAYWGKWLPWTIRRADAVIADSEATKRDLVRYAGIPAGRVRVVYPSGHEGFSPVLDLERLAQIKARHGIRGPYFLFVGTLEPRKNLRRVLEAFARFKARPRDFQLVIAGPKEFGRGKALRQLVSGREIASGDVVLTGYVPREDLNQLYCGAEALVFPSLYEGFGIPVLEAMACGTPVLTSAASSLPEVAGEAALFVDPTSVGSILEGMVRLSEDRGLRLALREKGFQRIPRFSWQRTARETMRVYAELV